MKVFIAQRMSGLSDIEVDRVRDNIIANLDTYIAEAFGPEVEDEVEILDQFHLPEIPNGTRLQYLHRSLGYLITADLVIFEREYEKAKGCLVEKFICDTYGIRYIIAE